MTAPSSRRYLLYDVFTGTPFLGNALAVFSEAAGLDDALMQRVAREMNLSETTFVLPAESPGTDVRMRIFTPARELPIAGHPTIGSTFALAQSGVITPRTSRFVFGLNIGPVPVELEWEGEVLRFVWMTQPVPAFSAPEEDRNAVARALALDPGDLLPGVPVQEVSCGVPYLIVPLRDSDCVDRAVSDTGALRGLAAARGAGSSVYLFSRIEGSSGDMYARMFAPDLGIGEDPATGSAAGPLGSYLVEHGMLSPGAPARVTIQQGVAMGRASRLLVEVTGEPGAIREVKVGGEAVLVGRGELYF